MKVTIEEVIARQEPIDCAGIKARRGGTSDWIMSTDELNNYETEFDATNERLLELLNEGQGKRYRKCIAWSQHAGCNYACFEMCDEWQREQCEKQQEKDKLAH